MVSAETPEVIAASRTVTTDAILQQRAHLGGYPHHYLMLHCYTRLRGDGMRSMIIAADYLRHFGWELLTVTHVDNNLYGIMRRQLAPPPPQGGGDDAGNAAVSAGS